MKVYEVVIPAEKCVDDDGDVVLWIGVDGAIQILNRTASYCREIDVLGHIMEADLSGIDLILRKERCDEEEIG